MSAATRLLSIAGTSLVVVSTACGSGGGSLFGGSDKPAPTYVTPDDGGTQNPFGGDGQDPDLILQGCASETKKATPLPLDLVLMLDTSGSMSLQIAQSVSKYQAVSNALSAFVADPSSAGIGVGLSFFPTPTAGSPATCTQNAQCPANSVCSYRACSDGSGKACDSNADCNNGVACVVIGRCANDRATFCFSGQACGPDVNGLDRGTCIGQTSGVCLGNDSCQVSDYAIPKVAISPMPAGASGINAALASHAPDGNTPTSAALAGALQAATNYANATPGHSVIAVLATDGLPTECNTSVADIAQSAKNAFNANPRIKTFVVGVFSAAEQVNAQTNLDLIAANGGTNKAFIVTQGASTTQQFVAAMNAIRGAALPCEYDVPVPTDGKPDYGRINVLYTPASGLKALFPNKANAAACAGGNGWYYDVDPAVSTPKKITLCPATCDSIHSSQGQVDVVIGCVTQVN